MKKLMFVLMLFIFTGCLKSNYTKSIETVLQIQDSNLQFNKAVIIKNNELFIVEKTKDKQIVTQIVEKSNYNGLGIFILGLVVGALIMLCYNMLTYKN